MSKVTPLIIVALVIAVAVGAILFALRRQPAKPAEPVAPPVSAAEKTQPQGVHVEGADIEQKDASGKLDWKVSAGGQLQFDKGRQTAVGKNVKFELAQAGKSPLTVTAPAFEADYSAKKLTFSEGVSGRMSDGSSTFVVSRLVYDFSTRKLVGSGGARFTQGLYSTTADEIVVDSAHKKVRLRGGVKFSRG